MKAFLISFLLFILSANQKEAWNEICLMDIGPRLCNATSTFENADWKTFAPTNIFDHNTETCWAVGKDALGTKIYAILDDKTPALKIANGWQKSKQVFQQYGRVKKISISVLAGYSFPGYVNEIGRLYRTSSISKAKEFAIKDVMGTQTIVFPFDWKELVAKREQTTDKLHSHIKDMSFYLQEGFRKKEIQNYILYIEIKDYYKGSKNNATCISEIYFTK